MVAGHGVVKPGAGIAPGAVGSRKRDVEAMGRLFQGQAAKETQFHELGLEGIVGRELFQGLWLWYCSLMVVRRPLYLVNIQQRKISITTEPIPCRPEF
jgi:hypothetical protein